MPERPIIFSGPVVSAILEGRKTQTRRCVRWPAWSGPDDGPLLSLRVAEGAHGIALYKDGRPVKRMTCPYGQPGDRLWIRETWWQGKGPTWGENCIVYDADKSIGWAPGTPFDEPDLSQFRKRPSIHMPRWASRITLEVTGVRVERVQEISNQDAFAEGCTAYDDRDYWACDPGGAVVLADTPRDEFQTLWDSINGKKPGRAWADSPWCWCVEFKLV